MMYKMLSHIIFVNRLQSYGLIPNKETKQRKNKNNGGKVDSLISNQRYFDKFLRNDSTDRVELLDKKRGDLVGVASLFYYETIETDRFIVSSDRTSHLH